MTKFDNYILDSKNSKHFVFYDLLKLRFPNVFEKNKNEIILKNSNLKASQIEVILYFLYTAEIPNDLKENEIESLLKLLIIFKENGNDRFNFFCINDILQLARRQLGAAVNLSFNNRIQFIINIAIV